MRTLAVGIAIAAAGFGLAIASRTSGQQAGAVREYPAGCIIRVKAAPGHLPRAGLVVENRRNGPVRAWLEGRAGLGLERVDFGTIGVGERRVFTHLLPTGRNVLLADELRGRTHRQILFVTNYGPGTCRRQLLWRIS